MSALEVREFDQDWRVASGHPDNRPMEVCCSYPVCSLLSAVTKAVLFSLAMN